MCRDAMVAAEHLRAASGCQTLSLLGVRLGGVVAATVAAAATDAVPQVDNLILWDPLADGAHLLKTFEELHRYALESQTRFMRKVKRSEPDQLFGHATSPLQRESFARAQLPAQCATRNLVLTTQGLTLNEPALTERLRGWNWHASADDIYWWQPQVTELAFASPDTAQQIIQFLDSGARA
jgi:pimeloyl-ACP methyl ester carboxylesterase